MGMEPARGARVTRCLALLAEPDAAFRSLLSQVLRGAHCEVEGCSSLSLLRFDLGGRVGSEFDRLLLVSSTLLASACAAEIAELARARMRNGLPPVQVLCTCELGEIERPLPNLEPAELIGILEKPFDIETFEALVRRSVSPLQETRHHLDSTPG